MPLGIESRGRYSTLGPMPTRAVEEATDCCYYYFLTCSFMWKLLDCFKSRDSDPARDRESRTPCTPRSQAYSSNTAQYQAPSVPQPLQHAASASSDDGGDECERGTLLSKRAPSEPSPGPRPRGLDASPSRSSMRTPDASRSARADCTTGASSALGSASSSASRLEGTDRRHARGSSGQGAAGSSARCAAGVQGDTELDALRGAGGGESHMPGVASDDEEDVCPTCLEAYTEVNPKVWSRCGHSYHLQCVYAWLERKDTCPMCGAQMVFDEDIIM